MMPGQGGPPQQGPPNDSWKPVFLCGERAYIIEGDVAIPAPPELLRRELGNKDLMQMQQNMRSRGQEER